MPSVSCLLQRLAMHAHRRPGADREWETRKKKTRVENLPTRESQDRKEGPAQAAPLLRIGKIACCR